MHAKNYVRSSMAAALALLLVSACNKSHEASPGTPAIVPDDDLGISLAAMPLLATACALQANVLTVTVKDGESAYITLRPDDNMVTVNGTLPGSGAAGGGAGAGGAGSAPQCAVAATGTINLRSDTGGTFAVGRSVIIDYINGVFMKSPSAAVASIKIDFTLNNDNGSKNSLRIRGSQGNDSYVFGAGTALGAALNLNAPNSSIGGAAGAGGSGSLGATDLFPDITFKNVSQVVVAAGPGDDRLDASGRLGAGVGAVYPFAVSLFGNEGDDTIVGGLGDDLIVGGIGADILQGCAGDDTYDMSSVAAGSDIIAQSCTQNAEGSDTLDYGKRTGNVTLALSTTLSSASNPAMDAGGTSGEMGETARISDKIATIRMGAGDDTINVPMGSTVPHRIYGGAGNDQYTGLGAADIFDGEGGDDTCISTISTMDYSGRSSAVSVSICSMNCTSANADDGDQSPTGSTRSGTGAATTTAGGIDITTLTAGSGFTAASVGNQITLSACMTTTNGDNGVYTIVSYISATSVKLKIPGSVSNFALDASCSFSEALPNGTTNTGMAAALSAKHTTATVTGLSTQLKGVGKTIALLHTNASTGGGSNHSDDDGTYKVLELLSNNTSVAIDDETPVSGGANFGGVVTALDWTLTGPESDNVQCAHVLGTQGDDTLTGDQRANVLRGGLGNDTINGAAGNDNLLGEAGSDNLYGGAGDDTLIGSVGSDTLVGGDGNDLLEGDADTDTFTCDGKNSSTAAADGLAPGDADFRVDYVSGETLGNPHGCEF
jgi:Ca2+-binding RTX toxin-like protein